MKSFEDFGIDLRGKSGIEVKTVCPQCSHTRRKKNAPCMSVNTDKGVWHCWHCEWSGTLSGGEDGKSRPDAWRQKAYRKPEYDAPLLVDARAHEWLKARGISKAVIEEAKIGLQKVYFPQSESELLALQFPYYRGGECVNVKSRAIEEKYFRMVGGAERILYGLDHIAETTIVVEGEVDKLSMWTAGLRNCVSVPDGAPSPNTKDYSSKFDFLESAQEQLAGVKRFILAVDNDLPGQKLEEELARRLGREKCYRVTWPEGCKDANDVLLKHGQAELADCVKAAKPYPLKGVFELLDLSDRVVAIHEHGMPKAEPTGWRSLDGVYSVRSGECTIITGIPGHGKSEWLDALMVNLARSAGWGFGVFSPENQPLELHIAKLAEKLVRKPFAVGPSERISRAELDKALAWLNERVAFILPDEPTLDCILGLAKALVFRRGIRGLVIDPWNEIEHSRPQGVSETEYISSCLSKIRQFSRQHGVHTWTVAHPTKLLKDKDGTYPVPTPYDITGSAHWRNKADNCIAVWRDFSPHNRVVEVHVQKIRFKDIGRVGKRDLIYHLPTGCYYDEGEAPHEVQYGALPA